MNENIGKLLVAGGCLLVLVGLFFLYGNKLPFIGKLGNLPLDMKWEKENMKFYFPLGTSILISLLLTLFFRFFGGSGK